MTWQFSVLRPYSSIIMLMRRLWNGPILNSHISEYLGNYLECKKIQTSNAHKHSLICIENINNLERLPRANTIT